MATITATVKGSPKPPIEKGKNVVNGDFSILKNRASASLDTGDGLDEETIWTFYFDGKGGNGQIPPRTQTTKITSATLTLTLTPQYSSQEARAYEGFYIESLDFFFLDRQSSGPFDLSTEIPVDTQGTLPKIDLFTKYKPEAILDILYSNYGVFADPANPAGIGGRISMRYLDDALISEAKLELELTP